MTSASKPSLAATSAEIIPVSLMGHVAALVNNGATLRLEDVLVQAGRHFADTLNPSVIPGSDTRRQKATALAWYVLAMLDPSVQGGQLVVSAPGDPDIQRLGMEVLGVGMGIELLRSQGQIDARTLRKTHGTFDFEACGRGGQSRIAIELKGSLNGASIGKHQTSFRGKLRTAGFLSPGGLARGYNAAIGLIFSAWSMTGGTRGNDFQLLDPSGDAENSRDDAIRSAIRFYARRYDEVAGLPRAAAMLDALAAVDAPIEEIPDLAPWLGRDAGHRAERRFNRASLTFEFEEGESTYWGGFWDAQYVRPPFKVDGLSANAFPVAYTGIDRRVMRRLRARQFDEFLAFSAKPQGYRFSFVDRRDGDDRAAPTVSGYVFIDADGVCAAWFDRYPDYGSKIRREE
ncbi:MAG: hypothetical protein AMXMBFR56_82670 [Polyangiaceae bacterium]